MNSPAPLDLAAYLERIDYSGELSASLTTLQDLHLAHASHIPFENLDVLQKQAIPLDLDSLQAKLVTARRGGYCFEQNLLFAAVLRELGWVFRSIWAFPCSPWRHGCGCAPSAFCRAPTCC